MSKIVTIGGLNPSFLTNSPPVPHLGTTDVDVLLEVGFVYEREEMSFSWREVGLRKAGFWPHVSGSQPWRWYTKLNGMLVKLELLCDTYDSPGQEIALPGCDTVVAQNLKGPRPALLDSVQRSVSVPAEVRSDFPDAPDSVIVRFAGLGGYVMSKAAAVVARGTDKDYYDLVFVLIYNGEGGPAGDAWAVHNVMPPPRSTRRWQRRLLCTPALTVARRRYSLSRCNPRGIQLTWRYSFKTLSGLRSRARRHWQHLLRNGVIST